MAIKIKNFAKGVFITYLIFSCFSCHNLFKEDEEPETNFLVSYEMEKAYLPVLVETLFDQLINEYPEMASIRDKVKHGIII